MVNCFYLFPTLISMVFSKVNNVSLFVSVGRRGLLNEREEKEEQQKEKET